jgi:hypothetical protein
MEELRLERGERRGESVTNGREEMAEGREGRQHLGFVGFGGAHEAVHQLASSNCPFAEFDGICRQRRIVVLDHASQTERQAPALGPVHKQPLHLVLRLGSIV